MSDTTRFFLWLVASGFFFAVLGLLFGAVTAYLKEHAEQASGSLLGRSVAHAFNRISEEPLPPRTQNVLAGAADGFVFGAVVGLLIGWWAAWPGHDEWARLRWCFGGGLALVLGALMLGLAARGLASSEAIVMVGLFVGGMVGALAGYFFAHGDGLMVGLLAGSTVGASVTFRRREPS
jgi:hypothetical protein